ncbi:hypothetical protein VPH35_065789 [Triticum aestivum]
MATSYSSNQRLAVFSPLFDLEERSSSRPHLARWSLATQAAAADEHHGPPLPHVFSLSSCILLHLSTPLLCFLPQEPVAAVEHHGFAPRALVVTVTSPPGSTSSCDPLAARHGLRHAHKRRLHLSSPT